MLPPYRDSTSTFGLIDPLPQRIQADEVTMLRDAKALY
jgi:hypothetical protein